MVNEINKPNDQLAERVVNSSRQLREMQEEHQQLIQEMEVLRSRATELSQMQVQRQQVQQQITQSSSQTVQEMVSEQTESSTASMTSSCTSEMRSSASISKREIQQETKSEAISKTESISSTSSKSIESHKAAAIAQMSSASSFDSITQMAEGLEKLTMAAAGDADADDDDESTEYLQKKIAEIAALKAQYKRVQHMVNTTNLIEEHLKTKSTVAAELQVRQSESTAVGQLVSETATSSSSTPSSLTSGNDNTQLSANNSDAAKEELLSSMFEMFNDFSDDLRGQADSLRAERERIKALKEELISRRRGDS